MVQWEMETCVRGYYIYQSLWTPALNVVWLLLFAGAGGLWQRARDFLVH